MGGNNTPILLESNIMSFAVALENNATTVYNIEKILNHLKMEYLTDGSKETEALYDWLNSIYKLLTDFTIFAENENEYQE